MRPPSAAVWAFAVALVLSSCSAGTPMLTIVLLTDLAPSTELARTRVTLRAGDVVVDDQITTFSRTRVFGQVGVAVGAFDALHRPYVIDFVASSRDGTVVAHRVIERAADGPRRITILLTRSCLGVECPDACHAGRCVSSACFEESPDACGPPECADASDCPRATMACAEPFCSASGTCFTVAVPVRCEEGEVCDLGGGCVLLPIEDAGPRDAAPSDAGPVDAAHGDAGESDAGESDAGESDAGESDAGESDAGESDAG